MAITNMGDAYYELVRAGLRTINQVPTDWRASVQAKIDEYNTSQVVDDQQEA